MFPEKLGEFSTIEAGFVIAARIHARSMGLGGDGFGKDCSAEKLNFTPALRLCADTQFRKSQGTQSSGTVALAV
ncbi:hypothetical protein [Microcoleus sp. FACHB-672]|uniref:hypothetical protein n=1 Tax=Microcoleus sp. FACHB-672 TaxID=2692825 RepID=UPI001684A195|nr:hypothetical protein [Microcoleus sp. FACHB-672]MBD2041058.1 hypothetical protein [Microcoleus sp. FACHB-672]